MQSTPESALETPVAASPILPEKLSEEAIIAVTALAHALCHIAELVFAGVMLAVMREFTLEPQQATSLALLGYVLMGAGALPVGVWVDSWGAVRVLRSYFVLLALASLAVAAAPNVGLLFLAFTGLGLAVSIYHPAGLTLLSLGVRARGRAMGINGVAGSIGVALGPLLGMLAAALEMWRLAYVVVAGLALTALLLMELARRWQQRVQSRELRAQSQRRATEPGSPEQRVKSPEPEESERALSGSLLSTVSSGLCPLSGSLLPTLSSGLFGWRPYLPLGFLFVAMMLGGFNYRCLVTALPTYLSGADASSAELARGGVAVFLALLVGGFGQYFGGWTADSLGARPIYLALISLLVPLALLLGSAGGTPYALAVACVLAFCLFAQQPVENAILAECTSVGRRSVSYGTKFALTFGVGALGADVTGRVWHSYHSLGPVFYLIAVSAVLMAGLQWSFMKFHRPRVVEPVLDGE